MERPGGKGPETGPTAIVGPAARPAVVVVVVVNMGDMLWPIGLLKVEAAMPTRATSAISSSNRKGVTGLTGLSLRGALGIMTGVVMGVMGMAIGLAMGVAT